MIACEINKKKDNKELFAREKKVDQGWEFSVVWRISPFFVLFKFPQKTIEKLAEDFFL